MLAYAEQLRQLGAESEAEQALRAALKRQYESHLARLYGLVRGSDLARQLQTAEGWLKDHPDDPSLLLTLGRLSLQNRLWARHGITWKAACACSAILKPVQNLRACSLAWAIPSAATSCSRKAWACLISVCWHCRCQRPCELELPMGARKNACPWARAYLLL